MPQRRLALCGYQPSPAEKAAFLAGGLPFSVPGAPPVRPARAEKRARQPKARPRPFGANCGGKGPAARQGPAGLFECARGKIARPNPMFSCVNTPKPGVFAPERRRARGVFPVWARAARGILCYSMRRACRTKRGKGCAHKAVCGVCAVFGHLRHAGVQPDAGHHQPRLGRQRQGAKRDKPSAGRGPRPFVRTDVGREVAEKIYERHCFFTEQLIAAGVDPKTAEADACRIEHIISDESFSRLKEAAAQEQE